MAEQKITGIDMAKTNFYLFSLNAHGKPVGNIKLSRNQLLNWLVQHCCDGGLRGIRLGNQETRL
ncbi:transposase [Salmonella enterica]|uniref:transposase n=1 Tax=Salmonella enterica TaxID=28901 RepID=UPI0034E63BE0